MLGCICGECSSLVLVPEISPTHNMVRRNLAAAPLLNKIRKLHVCPAMVYRSSAGINAVGLVFPPCTAARTPPYNRELLHPHLWEELQVQPPKLMQRPFLWLKARQSPLLPLKSHWRAMLHAEFVLQGAVNECLTTTQCGVGILEPSWAAGSVCACVCCVRPCEWQNKCNAFNGYVWRSARCQAPEPPVAACYLWKGSCLARNVCTYRHLQGEVCILSEAYRVGCIGPSRWQSCSASESSSLSPRLVPRCVPEPTAGMLLAALL